MQGQLDVVTPDGVVEGWCWNEQSPNERVTVVIQVDGIEAARTVAAHYREDLHRARVGDGCHFFRCVLPDNALGRSRAPVVTLVDANTGEAVGDAYTLRAQRTLDFDERLNALETQNRLLESRLAELTRVRAGGDGQAELFAVVGAFFERLSQDLARGIAPMAGQQLNQAVQAVTRVYPHVAFPPSEKAPAVSVLVEAAHPLPDLHACLTALRRSSTAIGLQVTVLDTGAFDETALLPSFTRGIRYVRTVAGLVPEWIEAVQGDASPVLLFLSGGAVVDPAFLEQIASFLDAHPSAGAVGGCILDPAGSLRRGGLRLVEGQLENMAETLPATGAEPVHALPRHAVAFRRVALEAVGGLDAVFGNDLDSAIIDVCFRLRQGGWSVAFHPDATVVLAGPSDLLMAPGRFKASDLLEQRWLSGSNDEFSPLDVGF